MDNEKWYLSKEEPILGCLLAMRQVILEQDELVWETVKYGAPCFMYKKRMFTYLMVEKKTNSPYILVVEGNRIEHPNLDQGDRKRMKVFRVNAEEDLPIDDIRLVLKMALDLYRDGTVRS